ncbi:hypothetical protein PMAYCL1PPCAC_31482 [Pristionchus mayeri]|uniref:C2H2-type domain-containing protein n=1 Tax=Pristionchus mayeri TaxID=1317129 RepID=A0AAN5ICL7_9BILA|nr:hypothetical protein PMAYCL1PPCAC_31482 [Pristionchus mayeri]
MSSIFYRESDAVPYSGPFTERDMLKKKREGKVSSTAQIYFTNGEQPDGSIPSYSLFELHNICGLGCPFIDPSPLLKKMGRTPTEEETKMKRVEFALSGIRASCKNVNKLEKEVDLMIDYLNDLQDAELGQSRKKRRNKKKKTKSVSLAEEEADEVVTEGLTPSREERLQKLLADTASLRSSIFAALSMEKDVKKVFALFKKKMTSVMRENMEMMQQSCDEEEEEEVTGNVVVQAMNKPPVQGVSIADFDKAPEKPVACSRTTWLGHLKMTKRFASAVYQMFTVMNDGCSRELDARAVHSTMKDTKEWLAKWEKNPQLQQLINHEIVKRLKEIEYFFCYYCMVVHFDLGQALAHITHANHNLNVNELPDQDSFCDITMAVATSTLQLMTKTPGELHDAYVAEFSLPLLKSGMRVPLAKRDSLPSKEFIDHMKEKYAAINGDVDQGRIRDPVYVASVLRGIISRHKSEVGRQLFADLDKYFRNGKTFYCELCGWMLTSRDRYYRHLKNNVHIGIVTNRKNEIGMNFDLLTFSINIHASEEK